MAGGTRKGNIGISRSAFNYKNKIVFVSRYLNKKASKRWKKHRANFI